MSPWDEWATAEIRRALQEVAAGVDPDPVELYAGVHFQEVEVGPHCVVDRRNGLSSSSFWLRR
jgi:hypothetical protein